ncbi:MAG: hypothetical protein QNK26_15410 [Moritella sp.]|uniref:hypothetical protein n=1 Tax=Moritella sp. TaxID=78556 RepID=UPI0029B88F39|nr:hypothetical protein [Moritella sp.]MDX2321973.1 hypothetical protein [Moritella sp.]
MKNTFKYCAIALAISAALTGCNDENTEQENNNNNGNPYVIPIASNVVISGDSYVGSTLTGGYKFIDPNFSPRTEGASGYDWRVDDGDQDLSNDLSIGNQRTLLLADSELNKSLYFCVTPKATGSSNTTGETKCSTPTLIEAGNGSKPEVNNVALDNSTPTVGDLLTGDYDYSDPEGDPEGISTFRWTQDGNDIADATLQTLMLTNQQETKIIEFCVTPVSTNPDNIDNSPLIGDEVCAASAAVLALAGDPPTATKPTITGEHTVGSTLTADYSYADADGDLESNSTFSWTSDGSEVSTTKTYSLQGSDVGKTIIFTVTPVAGTGTPTAGDPVPSDAINDVTAPVGDVPTIVLDAIDKGGVTYPEVGDVLGGSYAYTASGSSSPDDSTAVWKADNVVIAGVTCTTGSQCDLTLAAEHYNKSLTYCVTPKAVDSPTGAEDCSAAETVYGVVLSGTLEFGKELNLEVSGYNNPTIEWQVDVSNIQGPAGDITPTTRNLVTTGDAAKTFLIGDEVYKKIIDPDNAIDHDFNDGNGNGGNGNGIIDDADWAQASLAGHVTMDSGSADTNTVNGAHYIGKDAFVTITFTESGVTPITLTASATAAVTGGVYYDKADVTKRGIEPVRELAFGTVVYHRPITLAEAHHNAAIGFGATVAYPRYTKPATGIEWAVYRAEKDPADNLPFNNSDYPAVDSCLNLYDGAENDVWHLPVSRSDGSYVANGYVDQGNNPPMADADKNNTLIKLSNSINKADNAPKAGLLGTYIDRTTPNPKLNYTVSPTTGRILNGDSGSTAHWSATTDGTGKTNSVLFYEAGGSGNNAPVNGRFVSCVRAK